MSRLGPRVTDHFTSRSIVHANNVIVSTSNKYASCKHIGVIAVSKAMSRTVWVLVARLDARLVPFLCLYFKLSLLRETAARCNQGTELWSRTSDSLCGIQEHCEGPSSNN